MKTCQHCGQKLDTLGTCNRCAPGSFAKNEYNSDVVSRPSETLKEMSENFNIPLGFVLELCREYESQAESRIAELEAALEALLEGGPLDEIGSYRSCRWCGGRDTHTERCAYERARKLLQKITPNE